MPRARPTWEGAAAGLALLCAAAAGPATAQGGERHALWVFSDEVTSPADRQTLVQRSAGSGVDALYLSIYQPVPNAAGRRMYEDADVADLIGRAQAQAIGTWAAYGAPDWPAIGCSPSAFPLERMQEVLDYNADNPAAGFAGVALDIEPPDPQTPDELRDLLDLYACIDALLAPAGVQVAAAIRHFWDTQVVWNAQSKPAYQHIIDLGLDHVVVLAYRDSAGTACAGGAPDGSICLAEDEVAHASAQGRGGAVLVGLETGDCAPGCGPEKVTFFEEGQHALNTEAALVREHFAGSPGFGGFAIHRYEDAYLGGGGSDWPELNPAGLGAPEVPSLAALARAALALVLLASALCGRRVRRRNARDRSG